MAKYVPFRLPRLEDTRVCIWDILKFIAEDATTVYKVSDIAAAFEITPNDAHVRLYKLHKWGYITVRRQKRPRTFEIAEKGMKYLVKRFSGEKEKR